MLCFVFAALVVILDQFFKRWVEITLAAGGETVVIPGIISLMYVENTGAAFSILANQRWLLAGIAFVAAIVLIFILLRYTDGFWGTLGLAAVLGGTVGNLIDRVFRGYVVDMFRTLFMRFAIFNIADIFITLGFITFCVHFIISSIKAAKREKEAFEDAKVEDIDEQYDMYEYEEEQDVPDYDDFSETTVVSPRRSLQTLEGPVEYSPAESDLAAYFEPSLDEAGPEPEPEPPAGAGAGAGTGAAAPDSGGGW
jgi:signal peptidase II